MMDRQSSSIDLTFPSELGYEKIARETIAAFARRLGFSSAQVDNLITALSEACINAIEHGNACIPALRVAVHCVCNEQQIEIEVCDQGAQRYRGQHSSASIEQKVAGQATRRGMGLMLIQALVDEAGFDEDKDGGNIFRFVLRMAEP
jgi:serine/threonine-protein kinase RsbW